MKELVGEGPVGCDVPFPNAVMLTEEIARLRYSLTPEELERYRWLGERASLALEKTMIEDEEGRERVGGRGKALQGILEGPNRSHHLDVRGR